MTNFKYGFWTSSVVGKHKLSSLGAGKYIESLESKLRSDGDRDGKAAGMVGAAAEGERE